MDHSSQTYLAKFSKMFAAPVDDGADAISSEKSSLWMERPMVQDVAQYIKIIFASFGDKNKQVIPKTRFIVKDNSINLLLSISLNSLSRPWQFGSHAITILLTR